MRRLLPLLLLATLLAGCSDDGGAGDLPAAPPTSIDTGAPLPAGVQAFVDDVVRPGDVPFRATYRVLRKAGGATADVEVVAAPPSWQLRTGDLVFVDGPKPATCSVAAQRCVDGVREALLGEVGVFSRFFATGPAQALATDARRATAGEPETSTRTAAGVALRCMAIPQNGRVAATYCLTPEGVFGWVDTPAARYELTSYEPGPPGESTGVPYPIVADGSFLPG